MKDAELFSGSAYFSGLFHVHYFAIVIKHLIQLSLVIKKIFSAASKDYRIVWKSRYQYVLPDKLGITHNLKNSCKISLTIAGFSANGACPASSTISSEVLLIVSSNNFECSTGIILSLLPHMIRVGTS